MNSDPAVQSVEDKWQDSDKHYRCMCECAIHTTKKRHDWFGGRKYRLAHLFEKCRDVYKLNPTSIFKHEQCKAAHASSINLRVIYTILIILLLFDGDRLYATSVCGGNATNSGLCVAATASKTIVFCEPPSITTQPTDQIDCKGRIVSFSVVATGSGLTYTWQRKKPSEGSFTNIPAESNVSYPTPGTIRLQNVGNSFAPDGTKYQVVVSNANCSVTSNPATLTVNEITDIKPVSTDVTKCYGNNYSYTVTTSYPSNVISYQWKKSVSPGVWVIVTDGGSILGATTNQLNIAGGTPSESGEYRVYITFHASGADCNVSSDTRTRKLTFLPQLQAPVVTGNQTICYNTAPAQLTATPASGGSGTTYSYQWQSSPDNLNWNNIGTNSLNYQPPVLTSSTYYRIIATDTGTYGCSTATSISILITVNPLPTPIISGFSNVCPGASGIVYSTPFVTGHTYRWSATGASFYSGENTNTLTVTWTNVCSNSTGIVKVTETITATGCSAITPDYPVTITDNTAPTWTTVAGALNTSVECGDAAGLTASQALAPVATDNCSSVTYTKTSGSFVAGSCGVTGTYTNTWVAKDACLNTSTVFTQVIIITDNTSPIWTTVAGALNTSLECSDAAGLTASQALSPIATDNCGSVTYTKTSGSFVAGSCSATGTYTNTWVAKDACLNTSTVFTQVITITDNTVPTWTTVAGALNTSVECSNAAGLTASQALSPVATDNCSSVTYTKTSGSFVSGSSGATGTYTNTWVAKDACLNTSAVFTQIITITDNIAPTWTTIAGALNTSLECGDAAGLAAAQALASVATDNCSNVTYIKTSGSFVEGSCRATGTYTNTWVAKDACLNTSAVYTQVITIKDNTAPTWTTIAGALNTSLECGDAAGLAAAQALVPIAIDNCDADVTDIVKISGVFVPGGSPNEGTYTNTWTVTDACGNVSTVFTQVITISDNTAPIITCPANVTIDCEDNNTPAGTGTATVTDNYAPSGNITIIFSDVSTYKADPANVLHYNYTITRKWRATDVTGNFSECTQTITVHDVTASAITCPANVTIDCEDDTTPAGTGTAKAIDNYAPAGNITITFSDVSTYKSDPASVLHYNYTITRKWRATDVTGNFSECTQTITVHDVTAPAITCPANVTIDCEDDTTPAGTGTAKATDNYAPAGNITITFSDVSTYKSDPASVLHYNYTISRKWRATDVTGNFSECTQTITVHDVTASAITCPVNVIIDCEDDNTPTGTGTATVTNNYGNITIAFSDVSTYKSDPASILHYNYTITRKWRATDVAGNFSECTQTITVHDVTASAITCPANVTIDCEDDTTPAGTGTAKATDNYAPAGNITITFSDVSTYKSDPESILHYNYTITRKWRATDVAGNFSECTQTITLHDVTASAITCPSNVTIDCEDDNTPAGTGTAKATDNYGNITITFSDISTYKSDPASVLHYNYTITRKWRATDVAGNFSECTQTITVHDVTAPAITCPSNVTIDCEDDNTPAGTGTAKATDNYAPAGNITITFSDVSTYKSDPESILHYNYTITRKWRATDVAGNFSECTQTITVHDVTASAITCPANVTIDCEDDNTPAGTGTAKATDNYAPAGNITITFSDVSTYKADPSSILHYNYTITRKWRATDVVGNFSECTQTITVQDVTASVITCPANVTIDCEDDNTPAGTGTAKAADNYGNITITFSDISTYKSDPASVLHYNYTITRKWRATDVSGNFSECTQTITVHDFTAPKYTVPPTVTICRTSDYTYNIDPSITGDVTDESDNCTPGALLNATYTDDLSGLIDCNNSGFIVREWTLTDIEGNTSVKVQTIWVEPTPQVVPSTLSQKICNDGTTNVKLSSPSVFTSGVIKFKFTATAPSGLMGFTASAKNLPNGYIIADNLINSTDGPLTVTYTIIPVSPTGCNDGPSKIVTVMVNPIFTIASTSSVSNDGSYNINCNGLSNGSIQINLSGGLAPFVYSWTGPDGFTATTKNISGLKAGQYNLLITDSNYCTATETINLTEPGNLGMTFTLSSSTAGGFNINCTGDSTGYIDIEPINPVKTVDYLWADGIFGKIRMNLPAGDYNVIITDANNCHASSTITLTEPDSMKLIFDISQPFCPDKPNGEIRLNVTGGVMGTDYSYKWSDNSTGRNISNILKGFYKISVKDLNGCSIKDSVIVEPLNETCLIIPDAISPNGDLINDVWNIGLIELYPRNEIKIFNRWGEIIWRSEKGYPQPWDGKSNGSSLPIDSYHYIIDLHNGSKPIIGNVTIVR